MISCLFLFFFCSLRTSLVHEFTQVRAGVLRVLRHLLRTSRDLQMFNELQLNQLLCRSLDILLDNEEERVQALKLVRIFTFNFQFVISNIYWKFLF